MSRPTASRSPTSIHLGRRSARRIPIRAATSPTRICSQRQPRDELARRPPAPASHERFIGVSRCPHIVLPRVSHRHVVLPPLSRAYIYDLVPIEVGLRATAVPTANQIRTY